MQTIIILLLLFVYGPCPAQTGPTDSIDALARNIDTACIPAKHINGSAHIHGRYTGLAYADSTSAIRKLELRFDNGSTVILYSTNDILVKIVEDGKSHYPGHPYYYGRQKMDSLLLRRLEEDRIIFQSIIALLAPH